MNDASACLRARIRAIQVFLVPFLFLWTGHSFAQSPPSEPAKVTIVDDELPSKPATGLVSGTLRISFEQTPLMEVGLATHNVVTQHSTAEGDEHTGSTWLCYTIVDGTRSARLWLTSDDTFGGHPDDFVTGIYVKTLQRSEKATDDCPDRSRQLAGVRFDNQIWLGASMQQIEAKFGVSPPASEGWWGYGHMSERIDRSRGEPTKLQVYTRFDIRLHKGQVVEIRASQISET
jgi:hypothetical protein